MQIKKPGKISILLISLFLMLSFNNLKAQVSEDQALQIRRAMPDKPVTAPLKNQRILVFSLSEGYQHGSIPFAAKMMDIMAEKTGAFEVEHSADMSAFEAGNLQRFDAVLFNNTTHLKFENQTYRKNLMQFVKSGKGIIGIHAASDNFYTWPEAAEMIGGVFDKHPWTGNGTWRVKISDPEHPVVASFNGKDFSVNDEIYRIAPRKLRQNCRVLLALDLNDPATASAKGIRISDRDLPISWVRDFEKGRVFYSSLGHNFHIYWDPDILAHYLAGIQFALGDLDVDITPLPFDPEQSIKMEEIKSLLDQVKTYEYGQSREALTQLSELLRIASASSGFLTKIENELLDQLKSEKASLAGKQFICEELSVFGSDASVNVLQNMLTDKTTAEMALFALDRIPGKKSTKVLRKALGKISPEQKPAVIRILGSRQDKKSLKKILSLIKDADPEIASAAIAAAGNYGGDKAAKALKKAIKKSQDDTRSLLLTDAYLACAKAFQQEEKTKKASKIYKELFRETSPASVQYAALSGMLSTSETNSAKLILEILKDENSPFHEPAIRLIHNIPETEDLSQIAGTLPGFPAEEQIQLLSALAGKDQPAVLEAILTAAKSENETVRLAAITVLGESKKPQVAGKLVEIAASNKGMVRQTARVSLYRISGTGIDEALLASLPEAGDEQKIELIRAFARRQYKNAVPDLLQALNGPDPKIRIEAAKALTKLVEFKDMPALVDLLMKTKSDKERRELEKALVAAGHTNDNRDTRATVLLEKLDTVSDKDTQTSFYSVFGKIGDPRTLPILKKALDSKDADLKLAAIRALSNWPDAAPIASLENIFRTEKNEQQKVLALRGFVRLVSLDRSSSGSEKVQQYKLAMSLAGAVNDKRMILSGLSTISSLEAFNICSGYLDDEDLKQEAETAAAKIAMNIQAKPGEILPVLKKINRQTSIASVKRQSLKKINELERFDDHITVWQVAGPFSTDGKSSFDFVFDPEKPGTSVDWKTVPANDNSSKYWFIDLESLVGGANCAAYLKTRIWSENDQPARLETGSDDGIKVWLNNQLIHAENASRPCAPGSDIVTISLKQGWNNLLLKITNAGGTWGACARLRQPDGQKLEGLKYSVE